MTQATTDQGVGAETRRASFPVADHAADRRRRHCAVMAIGFAEATGFDQAVDHAEAIDFNADDLQVFALPLTVSTVSGCSVTHR
jgi:hypothetical protein